jgi:hypothetical protein
MICSITKNALSFKYSQHTHILGNINKKNLQEFSFSLLLGSQIKAQSGLDTVYK